jgi:hypothetical protein
MMPWITLSWSLIFIILAAGFSEVGYIALSIIFLRAAELLFLISIVIFPISLCRVRRFTIHPPHNFELGNRK